MDKLKECALEFKKLFNKDYYFYLGNGTVFKTFFARKHFAHLMGLNKLSDIKVLAKLDTKEIPPTNIYKDILSGYLNYDIISASEYFNLINNRIDNFNKLNSMLSEKNIVDFDKSKVTSSSIKADLLLYQGKGSGYLHLCLAQDKAGYYYPETFLLHPTDYYVKNQNILKIKSLRVVDVKTKRELEHRIYRDNIRAIATTDNERKKLDAVERTFNIPADHKSIQKYISELQRQTTKINTEIRRLKVLEDKFNKGKLYLDNIAELQKDVKNTSVIERLENKFKELGFTDEADYTRQLKTFRLEKDKKLPELENLENSNAQNYRALNEARYILKSIDHREIIELYKDECVAARDWSISTTGKVRELLDKEGRNISYKEITYYSGPHQNLIKSILQSFSKGMDKHK